MSPFTPQGADQKGHSKWLNKPFKVEAKENLVPIELDRMP